MAVKGTLKRFPLFVLVVVFFVLLSWLFSGPILVQLGQFLICDQKPVVSDAVVVLNTGFEYYPRLIEAADLFRKGFARKVVINGNRKTDALRELEKRGFEKCCPWYEEPVRILEVLGVPRKDILSVNAEDAYDTVSEAKIVGRQLSGTGFKSLIITTSKSHTRRANHIWSSTFKGEMTMCTVSAKTDPFSVNGWWKQGRQIRWVLAEYGAWIYYWWKEGVGFGGGE
jgi:uncharacterized SAM-binding protein YcdF (DUF218 family)